MREEASLARRRRPRKRRRRTAASTADKHALYERAVQDPETDATTMARLYRRYRKKDALVLREDFCGTATLCTHWVKARPQRRAVGVDLDAPTLAWAKQHNVEPAGAAVAKRITLLEANVLEDTGIKADITCALNFSYSIFKTRKQLREYFEVVRRGLKRDGVFILDLWGGTEVMDEDENRHDHGDFAYRWEQEFFDPLSHEMACHIHFEFPDGSSLSPAFSYDWRLWMAPELRDILLEAGFSAVHLLWERTDEKGDGTGAFYEPKRVENQASWWTYIVAER